MKPRGITLGLLVLLAVGLTGCKEKTAQEKREAAEVGFRRQVIKKSPLEVVNAVGTPKEKWRRDTHNFFYKYILTEGQAAGKALAATVVFRNRQVESVRFQQIRLAVAE